MRIPPSIFFLLFAAFGYFIFSPQAMADEVDTRRILTTIVLAEEADDETARNEAVAALSSQSDVIIKDVISAWRVGKVLTTTPEGSSSPIALLEVADGEYQDIATGDPFLPSPDLAPEKSRAGRSFRKVLAELVEFLDLESPDPNVRIDAVQRMGMSQDADIVPILREKLTRQNNPQVHRAFEVAINTLQLSSGTREEKLSAVTALGDLHVFPASDLIKGIQETSSELGEKPDPELATACTSALERIDSHQRKVEFMGTLFRGLSLGSVLLIVAYGLAITFGLMGVINMAHGEFIAVGGYTVYLVQNLFTQWFGSGSFGFETYFLVALPCAFLSAALLGIVLERGVIRFLYKRPIESLLATWGVSMVMQQLFRMNFGAANVAVSSPNWLAGSLDLNGVTLSYSRLFVIVFAIAVIFVTYLLLTRTPWGLNVRATMQNRQMASAIGVRSTRVNMLTFAFGSGLAGLAGAFLSQIGNVGPSMGQGYIVDSFMVVVVGGVGNLLGTALSAFGIGMVDQALQPLLGPVMGKISVLFGIILFLQFKPGGIFPARTRSLDD